MGQDTPQSETLDLAAAAPPPEMPKLSRKQIGQLRRQHLTLVHSQVVACGHAYDTQRPPRLNCLDCWYAFFKTSADIVELHDELSTESGTSLLVAKYGIKFVKSFKNFLRIELANMGTERNYEEGVDTERNVTNTGVPDLPDSEG